MTPDIEQLVRAGVRARIGRVCELIENGDRELALDLLRELERDLADRIAGLQATRRLIVVEPGPRDEAA